MTVLIVGCKNDDEGTGASGESGRTLVTEWATVPAGPYTYGEGDELKTLDYGYKIMKYEVTNAQYMQYLRDALAAGEITVSGSFVYGYYPGDQQYQPGTKEFYLLGKTSGGSFNAPQIFYVSGRFFLSPDNAYLNHPVGYVSWFGAWAFAHRYHVSLPTEEEWEKAARGNTGYDFPWGDTITPADANYYNSGDPFTDGTTPVGYYNGSTYGSFQTNDRPGPYGAYDMAGNAWEWTASHFGGRYGALHVLRGGGWASPLGGFPRSWERFVDDRAPTYVDGFRCVKRE